MPKVHDFVSYNKKELCLNIMFNAYWHMIHNHNSTLKLN